MGISGVPESMVPVFIGANPSEIETGAGALEGASVFGSCSSGRSHHGEVPSMKRHLVPRLWLFTEHEPRVVFLRKGGVPWTEGRA